jgi:hypothetical protein
MAMVGWDANARDDDSINKWKMPNRKKTRTGFKRFTLDVQDSVALLIA